jgi:hypothetical protein
LFAKVSNFEKDIQGFKLAVDSLEELWEEVISQINKAIPHPDSSSNLKASTDEINTYFDHIDAKVSDIKTDIQEVKVDVDNLEAFEEALTPPINEATSCLPCRGAFPRFSGRLHTGTCTTLHQTVLPETYSKIFLHGSSLNTSSYVTHNNFFL